MAVHRLGSKKISTSNSITQIQIHGTLILTRPRMRIIFRLAGFVTSVRGSYGSNESGRQRGTGAEPNLWKRCVEMSMDRH